MVYYLCKVERGNNSHLTICAIDGTTDVVRSKRMAEMRKGLNPLWRTK